jgi:hypothetical protein
LEKDHHLIHREMLRKMVKIIVEYLNIENFYLTIRSITLNGNPSNLQKSLETSTFNINNDVEQTEKIQ